MSISINDLKGNPQLPEDWETPKWSKYNKVHCWRNYASEELKVAWDEFDYRQKMIIAINLQGVADSEHWD
jgi:hypothetical protein